MNSIKAIGKQLLDKLIQDLTDGVPELLSEIVPNGYQESPYYFLRHCTSERMYEVYRGTLLRDAKELSKLKSKFKALSLEEFKMMNPYRIVDANEEMSETLIHILKRINLNGYAIDLKSNKQYYLFNSEDFDGEFKASDTSARLIKKVLAPQFIYNDDEDFDQELELPLFCFLFKILKSNGLDWKYHNLSLETLTKMAFENEHQSSTLFMENFLASFEDVKPENNKSGDDFISIDEVFRIINTGMPSNILVAYFDVYRKWPEGHPPKIEDYR